MEEDMCAMEEQARHELAEGGLKLGVSRMSGTRVADLTRAE